MYAIKDGHKIDFHVTVGRKVDDNTYEFNIPRQFNDVHVLGLIYLQGGEVEWINMPKAIVEKHSELSDDSFRILVKRDNGKYSSGTDKWLRFKTIGEII